MPKGKHDGHVRGDKHHRWNDGTMLSPDGYVKVRVGKMHPLADPNGYCYEHKLVMFVALGRALRPGDVIHHRNGDRTDNRLDNLGVRTRGQHNALHNAERGRDASGRFLPRVTA